MYLRTKLKVKAREIYFSSVPTTKFYGSDILVGELCTYIHISIMLYLVASTTLHHTIALQVEVAYVFCA